MAAPGDRLLWRLATSGGEVRCHVLSCCSGAELQIVENDEVTIRELYPDKSDLYERARELRTKYEGR